jgi:hypothetical protein
VFPSRVSLLLGRGGGLRSGWRFSQFRQVGSFIAGDGKHMNIKKVIMLS